MRLPAEFLSRPIAHRGFHDAKAGRPENSRGAIQAAVDHGYGIEIDVQLTADDKALVFHDYDLSRLTGARGAIRRRKANDLATVRLLGAPDGPPVLGEVLAFVNGAVPLLIEIKDQDGALGEDVGPLENAVAQALDGYSGPVAVMSFNPHSVSALQAAAPDIPRGLVTDPFLPANWPVPEDRLQALRDIPDYVRVGASFISHNRADLASPRVTELKGQGAHILCWTVRSAAEEAEARKIADNITFEGYNAAFLT